MGGAIYAAPSAVWSTSVHPHSRGAHRARLSRPLPDRHVPYSYFTPIHAPWPECLYPNASLSHSACFDEIIHLFSSPCLSLAVASSIYICLHVVYILFPFCQCFIFPLLKQDKSLLKTVFRFSFCEFSRKLHSIIHLVFFCPRSVEHVLHSRTFLLYIHFMFE